MLPVQWRERLTVPVVAAPMTDVSGPDLVVAACRAGVIGSFPTHNAASTDELERWLVRIADGLAGRAEHARPAAPIGANLVVHRTNARLSGDLRAVIRGGVEVVIASVGSPRAVVDPLHDAGIVVLADVASLRHVDRAVDAGVDGLVLLTAGAGGQTGWANPFAFLRAVRQRYDGIVVLAGGVSDGAGSSPPKSWAQIWSIWALDSSPPRRASPRARIATPSSQPRSTRSPRRRS
jgi:nitronate monooxygenase